MEPKQTIQNTISGETLTLLVSEKYNRGSSDKYEVFLPAHHKGHPAHFHTGFIEIFTVKKGALDFYLNKEQIHVRVVKGQSITAGIRHLHRFANDHDEPTVFTVEAIPAGGLVQAFQLAYGIANEGGSRQDGLPARLAERLYFIKLTQGFLPRIPVIIQKIFFSMATFLLSVTGRKRNLDEYIK